MQSTKLKKTNPGQTNLGQANPKRRLILKAAGSLPLIAQGAAWATATESRYVDLLRQGNCVVLIRHSLTVPGIGDPPGMRLDDCSTQRDLSEQGRLQSRRIGQWFRQHQLMPTAVRSSQWCRCLHTGQEAFGRPIFDPPIPVQPWVALNSFFQGHGHRDQQIQEASAAARMLALRRSFGQFEVWVTHQVVISTLVGRYTAMGEMLIAAGQTTSDPKTPPTPPMRLLAAGFSINS
jgi:hypothetical protein